MMESWVSVPGFEGQYEVSDIGRVRSLERIIVRKNGSPLTIRARVLRAGRNPQTKYWIVVLGRGECKHVHELVLSAFVGPRPLGWQASHLNGNRGDNRLENLRWESPKANARRKCDHGTELLGEKQHGSRLTEMDVKRIRGLERYWGIATLLAREYNVSPNTILDVLNWRTWTHVTA